METPELKPSPLATKTSRALSDLSEKGVKEISASLQELLADVFALYAKTKNFHWHMTGPNFRDYDLLLDGHGDQIFEMTDVVAERIRKLGGMALRSIGDIASPPAFAGQRCFLANAGGHAHRVARRQRGTDQVPARYPRSLRPAQRCRHSEPNRELDRRNRKPGVVPLRNH
jgi:Ferritin-like domain